jgi:hypothetical protein
LVKISHGFLTSLSNQRKYGALWIGAPRNPSVWDVGWALENLTAR